MKVESMEKDFNSFQVQDEIANVGKLDDFDKLSSGELPTERINR